MHMYVQESEEKLSDGVRCDRARRGASARYAWLQIGLELSYVDITGEDGVEPYATNLHLYH